MLIRRAKYSKALGSPGDLHFFLNNSKELREWALGPDEPEPSRNFHTVGVGYFYIFDLSANSVSEPAILLVVRRWDGPV